MSFLVYLYKYGKVYVYNGKCTHVWIKIDKMDKIDTHCNMDLNADGCTSDTGMGNVVILFSPYNIASNTRLVLAK
jgi:hypothetical protein